MNLPAAVFLDARRDMRGKPQAIQDQYDDCAQRWVAYQLCSKPRSAQVPKHAPMYYNFPSHPIRILVLELVHPCVPIPLEEIP